MNPADFFSKLPSRPALSADSIHVIHIRLEATDEEIEQMRSCLSADELARADRYKVERARRQFVICRSQVRRALGLFVGLPSQAIEFSFGEHGKPSLKSCGQVSGQVEFSVSHSADHALLAVGVGRRLGIDLEQLDDSVRILKLAERFFSAREAAELNSLSSTEQLAAFFRGWTCKEAYLKATGFGLSFPLNGFSVSLDPNEPVRLLEVIKNPEEAARWKLQSFDAIPGFAAALMYEANPGDVRPAVRWLQSTNLM